MIDTVKLHISEYPAIDKSKLSLYPNQPLKTSTTQDISTGEYKSFVLGHFTDGEQLRGTKAFLNTDLFQLDINPDGCYLKFSIPKIANGGDNTKPVDTEGAQGVLDTLQTHLHDRGVSLPDFKSDTVTISRADVFANALTDYPLYAYQQVFSLMDGKRMKKREYGGDAYLWHNKSREISCYDKIQELESHGVDTTPYEGQNLLRIEFRALKSRSVRHNLPFRTPSGMIEHWRDLPTVYKQRIKEILFKWDDIEGVREAIAISETEKIKRLRDGLGGRYYIQKYISMVGIASILELFGSWDAIESALLQVMDDRRNVHRYIKRYKEMYLQTTEAIKRDKPVPIAQLYNELRTKFVA